ncbi:MAG: helix-turn-helix domain-containing protein [Actinomycetota bacterium]|uniref:Sigma-54 factor interaction domain-containing protein n=1 Tax=Mycobacterium lentiflavum TaxID=141349 RepID=A0ABY3UWE8_MYCLN|nr:helix-turn-helix domain-containing protein [Mycobacterium lentiflavum]MEE3062685.1 helix-turn-helix domain-containing protein [Actinomycetota bacterium]ULP41554.1 hypothetical protein MJO58_22280 [Mycobacterium lentiflavum]
MSTEECSVRSIITTSWRRVAMTGLRPSASVGDTATEAVDLGSRFILASRPVVDEIAAELVGSPYAVLLADRKGTLTDLRYGQKPIQTLLEAGGAIAGRIFREEVTGTNSIATALEIRKGLAVRGEEHYIESLKRFSCYGEPIIHPVTQRIEGVLDITCLEEHDNPLIASLVRRSARQIGERLLDQTCEAEKRVFSTFRQTTAHERSRPVIAVGEDIFLANAAAMQIVEATDHATLRAISLDFVDNAELIRHIQLCSGQSVIASINPIPGTGAAVFSLSPERSETAQWPPNGRRLDPAWTLISGEPGSGRTTTAHQVADASACWFEAGDIFDIGEHEWARRLSEAVHETYRSVVIEAIDVLPERLIARVSERLRSTPTRVIFTSSPPAGLGPAHAALAAQSHDTIELVPLRQRRAEIPALAHNILKGFHNGAQMRFTPKALEALAAHHWPGNFHELNAVITRVAHARRAGDITVDDLPAAYRCGLRRRLSPIEQAERDAIVHALRTSSGNKKAAAQTLGISRTTLYKAIRSYGILTPST